MPITLGFTYIGRKKFNEIYSNFQEEHYLKGELKQKVYEKLTQPFQTKELAEIFDRSPARLCDILMELKKEDKVADYKSGSLSYWIRGDMNAVIISETKNEYLNLLEEKRFEGR